MEFDLLSEVRDGILDPAPLWIRQDRHAPTGRVGSPDGYRRSDALFELPRPE